MVIDPVSYFHLLLFDVNRKINTRLCCCFILSYQNWVSAVCRLNITYLPAKAHRFFWTYWPKYMVVRWNQWKIAKNKMAQNAPSGHPEKDCVLIHRNLFKIPFCNETSYRQDLCPEWCICCFVSCLWRCTFKKGIRVAKKEKFSSRWQRAAWQQKPQSWKGSNGIEFGSSWVKLHEELLRRLGIVAWPHGWPPMLLLPVRDP